MNPQNKLITKEQYLEALVANNGNNLRTRKQLGLSYQVYYGWRKNDPDFDSKVRETMNVMVEFVEDKFTEKLEEGNLSALTFFLKCHGWNEKKEVKVSTDNTIDINTTLESIKKELETE